LVNGRSRAARIKETTRYREMAEKYQPNARKVKKKRMRYTKNRCMYVKQKEAEASSNILE
jgi:hypothetical protein